MEARRRGAARNYRLNVVVYPAARLLGNSLVLIGVVLHNRFILESLSWPGPGHGATVLIGYSLVSWLILYCFYRRVQRLDLGVVFLVTDIFVWVFAIYASGGEESWLFFLMVIRAGDQRLASFRRVLTFGHLSVLSYALLMGYLVYGEGRVISWPAAWTKIVILYAANLYLSCTAKTAEGFRMQLVAAVRMARRSIRERKEAEARLRWVIENASDIISVINADGTIQYESPSVERLVGWRPEELIGKQILDYVHPEDAANVVAAIARRIADPAPVNSPTEFRVQARDGSWHVLAAMSRATRDETGAVSLVVNSRDVTEQRALEEQLRQTQRLESIGQLAVGIAHDFRNLLTVIVGRSELVRGRLATDDPLRRHVELIRETATRGAVLTQQLLTFGRKHVLEPKVLDLNPVVAGVVPMLERLVGEHITIVTLLDPRLHRVRADQATIEQIIVNLVVNARDAMPDGGRVSLTTANTELDDAFVRKQPDAKTGPHAVLAVRDTGIGMDPETQAHIFEPFFTTKAPGLGTGLGLAVVYGIVKQHGGCVTVESAPGQGSTFRIYLPRAA